jgi:murein DD-endopeptidase MepM/ murein hydrolase activator NlpD
MEIESGFNPDNRSETGALGLMQIMPATYRELYSKYGKKYGLEDSITNPRTNTILGSLYMRDLYNGPANRNLETMVKMYNVGPSGNLSGSRPTNHWKKFQKSYDRFKSSEKPIEQKFDAKVEPGTFKPVSGDSGKDQGNRPLNVPYSPFTSSRGNPRITSAKGWRWGRLHKGLDIGAAEGTPMYAYLPGTITFSGEMEGYGYRVEWKDANGNLHSYSHLQKDPGFRVGQKIDQKQLMGYVGSTGGSTGPHLHWEIKNSSGVYQDPVAWTKANPLPKPAASKPQSLTQLQNQIRDMKPGEVLNIPGVGKVVSKKNSSGTIIKEYYGSNGLIDSAKFFELFEKSKQRPVPTSQSPRQRGTPTSSGRPQTRPGTQPSVQGNWVSNFFRGFFGGNGRTPQTSPQVKLIDLPESIPFMGFDGRMYYAHIGLNLIQDENGNNIDFRDRRNRKILEALNHKRRTNPELFKKQGGGLISPSKSNLPIPNSYTSYNDPRSSQRIFIQPIIIAKTSSTNFPSSSSSQHHFDSEIALNTNRISQYRS